MLNTMTRLLTGDALSSESRVQLEEWMVAGKTGSARLRAGIPVSWRVGDKTGTGENAATNDIAIIRPPAKSPILATLYFTNAPIQESDRDAMLAQVGKLIATEFR